METQRTMVHEKCIYGIPGITDNMSDEVCLDESDKCKIQYVGGGVRGQDIPKVQSFCNLEPYETLEMKHKALQIRDTY